MNVTKSGSVAVGAPMSLARLHQELEHYATGVDFNSFALTEEGELMIRKYIAETALVGFFDDKPISEFIDYLRSSYGAVCLHWFLIGALVAMRMQMIGRVK